MKDYLVKDYYGNSLQEWLISLAIIVGSVVLAKICYLIIGKTVKKFTAKTKTKFDDILVDKFEEPGVMAIILSCSWYAIGLLEFTSGVKNFLEHAFIFSLVIDITWFVARIVDAFISEYLEPYASKSETKIDDSLLPVIRKAIRFLIWSIGLIMGLNNAGFDVAALIAGLGIGGLALALASQDTVKNVIGGIIVILDKPFKIGDRINIESYDGIIEDIGIRSSRLRTLEGRQVTIPNMLFSDQPIVNVTREPTRKVVSVFGLTYDTKPANIQLAIKTLNEIAAEHPLVISEDTKCLFSGFGAFSLDITLIYYIKGGSDNFAVQNDMNQAILEQFNANGFDFAFPTQTLYNIEQKA